VSGVAQLAYRALLSCLPCSARARVKTIMALPQVMPQARARPLTWVTPVPRTRLVRLAGEASAELYLPERRNRPSAGVVVSLGANDLGLRDPRVIVLGEMLARSGFYTLVVAGAPSLSDPELEGPLGLAEAPGVLEAGFDWLAAYPGVDSRRVGLLSVCIGGSVCLMAAARPALASRVAFVFVIGPYLSLRDLLRSVASRTTCGIDGRVRPWAVDHFALERQRIWLLAGLPRTERVTIRAALASGEPPEAVLSDRALAVFELAHGVSPQRADELIECLGDSFAATMEAASPAAVLTDLRAETFIVHGIADGHIPVDESRRLVAALRGRVPLHYAEFELFEHANPSRPMPKRALAHELVRLFDHVSSLMRFA
jgi:hypothetical protein